MYRVLDADVFESYMAMEGWDSFPFLHTQINENGEYYIIRKNTSYGLSVYDHIVLDADTVEDGQMIY